MTSDGSASPTSLEIARRVLARGGSSGGPTALAPAAELSDAFARLCRNLRDAMGDDGSAALFARAFVRTGGAHPALEQLSAGPGGICGADIGKMVEAHGLDASRQAIEALVAALVDVLGRLIGEDMAVRIIDQDVPRGTPGRRAGTS